jgi:glycerol-3-phosphate O-acyltransferase
VGALDDGALVELLEDTIFHEHHRFEASGGSDDEKRLIDRATKAVLDGHRHVMEASGEAIVRAYGLEIYRPFSSTAFKLATRVLPGALTRLVTATNPPRLLTGDFSPARRLKVQGAVDHVLSLSKLGTVLLLPTHLSNLDSPLLGMALHMAGLPPFTYGAGLNLFSNPVMDFWLSRLGAYTVDRRKRNQLYKNTLKDYSIEVLRRRCHQIFFPGGTRSRSGLVEKTLKKGLLGTGLAAWQEGLRDNAPNPDVFVVPCTISMHLVLEAETLVDDAMARNGRSRFIIDDDEFSRPRDVVSFTRQVLNLDESVFVTLSDPLDVIGNPVDPEGRTLDPNGNTVDRRAYVQDQAGELRADAQRDRVYTQRVAERVVQAFHRDNVVLSTHVAAFSTWQVFASRHPTRDPYRLVRVDPQRRMVPRSEVLQRIEYVLARVKKLTEQGRLRHTLPATPEHLLDQAIKHFAGFHSRRALSNVDRFLQLDPRLVYYYRNRLVGYGLGEVG